MSASIECRGEVLGWIHEYYGDGVERFCIEMEGITGLEKLCRQADSEPIRVEGMPPMDYRTFKKEILSRTKKIYLSTHEYNMDFHPSYFKPE
ncbi:Uncharacterised protein [uncultured archaeon]|nr:Uncharacterised protein [uncultured archaeon]